MQTQRGLEFKHASFSTYLMSYETILEKTHEAAEVCRTLYSLLLESDSETKQQYIRWAKVQMEKSENDIDGILSSRAAGHRLHGYRQAQKRLALRLHIPSAVFSPAKTRA
jgi:hypothetical protein